MKVALCIGITAVVDVIEEPDGTTKLEMITPRLSLSGIHVPGSRFEHMPDAQQALDLNTIALDHVLHFLAQGAREKRDELGAAPTQQAPNGAAS